MSKVVYVGPYEEVDLALPNGDVSVKQNEAVEVPSELVGGLIEQGIWAHPKSSHSKKEED